MMPFLVLFSTSLDVAVNWNLHYDFRIYYEIDCPSYLVSLILK